MIGYLKGSVIHKKGRELYILVREIGYRVRVGEKLAVTLRQGDEAELWIHTHVREDQLDLYGFNIPNELELFETLLSVSGVGPKVALSIVGTREVAQIEKAVQNADVAFFQSVPGVGKKGAQKIIVDLKGKMIVGRDLDLSGEGDGEVAEALTQFGFSRIEVMGAVTKIDTSLPVEAQVREGLKLLGKRK
ncbi:Holliday junction DNA helicase RuvA [Microgenomates group bacterium RIFCSPLOWO2_01_FULL_47_10]|nr:MAG: Holliday junction DNA helicase RuvA [Microgenomates group bacterium RIFCSPLOWO2_01_FULL_47_10]